MTRLLHCAVEKKNADGSPTRGRLVCIELAHCLLAECGPASRLRGPGQPVQYGRNGLALLPGSTTKLRCSHPEPELALAAPFSSLESQIFERCNHEDDPGTPRTTGNHKTRKPENTNLVSTLFTINQTCLRGNSRHNQTGRTQEPSQSRRQNYSVHPEAISTTSPAAAGKFPGVVRPVGAGHVRF